jgi:hypothetical protein
MTALDEHDPAQVPAATLVSVDLLKQQAVTILVEAYKKHAAELLSIEDSQQKLLALLLGIYSAALTLVFGLVKDGHLIIAADCWLKGALTLTAAAIGVFGVMFSIQRNHARRSVRAGLVRIEQALGFYVANLYVADRLYDETYRRYAQPNMQQSFLDYGYVPVIVVGLAFIAAVWLVLPN